MRYRGLLAASAVILCGSLPLHAGAWNQPAGHGQLIITSSFFQTETAFGSSGAAELFDDRGEFRQILLNPYLELGVSKNYTLLANVNAPLLRYSNLYGTSSSAGLGDIEVGIMRRLNSNESRWAFSGQLLTLFPAYSASRNPAPGNHQEDVESRLLLGHGSQWAGRHAFWDAEAAYRFRSGAPADEFRSDLTGGLNLTSRVMAMSQLFVIKSLRNGAPFTTTNPNAQSDFDLYKAQISLVIGAGRGTRVQLGGNDAFSGRNTGRGQSGILAIWKSF
jgi:protein XagA